jgi:hypothetical protein
MVKARVEEHQELRPTNRTSVWLGRRCRNARPLLELASSVDTDGRWREDTKDTVYSGRGVAEGAEWVLGGSLRIGISCDPERLGTMLQCVCKLGGRRHADPKPSFGMID